MWRWSLVASLALAGIPLAVAQEPSPVAIDFDLEPGDQQQRAGVADPATRRLEAQLLVSQAPELYGWSATIEYDPAQVRYVSGSFVPGDFLPGFVPLVDENQPALVQVGGGNFTRTVASGDAELGRLQFELAEGLAVPAALRITRVQFRRLDAVDDLQVEVLATLALPGIPAEETPVPELLELSGDAAIARLTSHNACPGCDLRQAQLPQASLAGADLHQADLSGAVLWKANLTKADLRGADLTEASLLQADLREADLTGAILKDARLGRAKLQGATLANATVDTLKLQGMDLSGVIWVDGRVCGSGSFNQCK